jgi:hypothetical protein
VNRYRFRLVAAVVLITAAVWLPRAIGDRRTSPLPERLTDAEYWDLISRLSEPNGHFRSDTLVSNEVSFQHVIPDLTQLTKPGGAYVGVGPEQNFTYIAALRPRIAFILDIRRGNLQLHLLYKALFEQSRDRVEFVSRLFSRPTSNTLDARSTAADIVAAYQDREANQALHDANLAAVRQHLTRTRRLPLEEADLSGIAYIYRAFHTYGLGIQYGSTSGRGGRFRATYAELVTATDAKGQPRGYLASEEAFAFVKDLHARNMVVPVVGDFGGRKALRAIGRYLDDHGTVVSAFYLSNVEQYLRQAASWRAFCGNAARLPMDGQSQFIRAVRNGAYGPAMHLNSELGTMVAETRFCH